MLCSSKELGFSTRIRLMSSTPNCSSRASSGGCWGAEGRGDKQNNGQARMEVHMPFPGGTAAAALCPISPYYGTVPKMFAQYMHGKNQAGWGAQGWLTKPPMSGHRGLSVFRGHCLRTPCRC